MGKKRTQLQFVNARAENKRIRTAVMQIEEERFIMNATGCSRKQAAALRRRWERKLAR
jgi:hypothetical protein